MPGYIYENVHEPLTEDEIAGLLSYVNQEPSRHAHIQVRLHQACLGAVTPDSENSTYDLRSRLVAAIYVYWFLKKKDVSSDEKTIRFFAKLIHRVANLSEASVINMRMAFKDFSKDHLQENLVMAILREFIHPEN